MLYSPRKIAILTLLAVLPIGATGWARSRPNRGQLTFNPSRLERVFKGTRSEAARQTELALAAQNVRHPDLPKSLQNAIESDIKRNNMRRSTLLATELFCNLGGDETRKQQLAFAESPATPVAVVASSTLAEELEPNAFDALRKLAERPEYSQSFGMRRSIVDGVANYKRPEAVKFLINAHENYPGQLRYEVTRHLMKLTGQNHGGFSDRWQEWWDDSHYDFDFTTVVPLNNVKDLPWPDPVPRLFEVPIYAYRIMFVVDRSRSMLSTRDDVTRMEEVQREFERVLKELKPEARFNVISYSKGLKLWKKDLVPATLENRLAATRHVWSLKPDTSTSFFDAVSRALDDAKDLELIVVLSDGKPTAGKIVEPNQIVDVLTKKNQFHEVSITALGLDLQAEHREFLKKLTDQNFGELWEIR